MLTHDVEGQRGYDRVKKLAEIEMELGFRSSFNFIPEGEYSVSKEILNWLVDNNFEVGVHDLKHDGKLFSSERSFCVSAKKINEYLRDWNAAGYRSGFMLRNLEWIKKLNIEYDSSTFDTDPFEPMPDGANTIFPFWYGGNSKQENNGYVELPYTLPQDSTLFLLLKEKTSDIWKRKLDWIAGKKGMALLNVHPDYIQFEGEKKKRTTFSIELYINFLTYLKRKYVDQFWQPLPKEVATWVEHDRHKRGVSGERGLISITEFPNLAKKRVAVLLFSHYPSDSRPRRAAEAMVQAGMEVDLICLRGLDQDSTEIVNGVNVKRISIRKSRSSKLSYIKQYVLFLVACSCHTSFKFGRKRYDIVHVHNMPDFLVFASVIQRLLGAKSILDLHDPMPELMESIYGLSEKSKFVNLLKIIEKISIKYSNLIFTPNIAFKELFSSRSCRKDKIAIVMNSPEESIFDPNREIPECNVRESEFRIMHHGSIVHRHGIDLLIEAFNIIKNKIPYATLEIYGEETDFLHEVLDQANRLGVLNSVNYHGLMPQERIADEIIKCSVGVVPNRKSKFTNLNFPTRLFEYLSMNRPVIAPDTVGIRDYFDSTEMIYWEQDNVNSLVDKLLWVYSNQHLVKKIIKRGKNVYRRNLWSYNKNYLLSEVDSLLQNKNTKLTH